MSEERERGILFRGMGNSAGTGPKNEEVGEGPEPGNKSRTDSEGSRKEEIITYEESESKVPNYITTVGPNDLMAIISR